MCIDECAVDEPFQFPSSTNGELITGPLAVLREARERLKCLQGTLQYH